MKYIELILKEILHRRLNFAASVFALTAAVSVIVTLVLGGAAYQRETTRIVRDMGQNLRIIPRETSPDQFWMQGFSEHTMPEEYVNYFADVEGYSYTHLTAKLQKRVNWKGLDVLLTGILPEVLPADKRHQKPMKFYAEPKLTYSIARGDVYVGNLVAQSAGIEEGDTIEIFGTSLKVKNVLSRVGGKEDIRIYGHLHDIQQSLDLKGEINEIEALECLCMMNTTKGVDPWEKAERQLAQILPQGKVIRKTTMAEMRSQYRSVIESYLVFIIPIVLILSGSWIAILAMNNVRARLSEIAIMKTVGFTSGRIALVFIGKSILAGLVGAGFGCAAGALLALNFAPRIFKVTAKAITIDPKLMVLSVFLAVVFMITWSLIPMVYGILQEPADVLGKE